MNLGRLTGSRLALAGACLYPFREDVPWVDVAGRAARVGSAFDAIVSARTNRKPAPTPPDEDIADDVWALVRVAEEHVSSNGWRAQVTWALDPRTGAVRELGMDLERKYAEAGLLPDEIALTCDRVRFHEGRGEPGQPWSREPFVEVRDWKTGRSAPTLEARRHAQLRALGYCAAKVHGVHRAYIALDAVLPVGVIVSDYTLEEWELDVVCRDDLRSIVEDMRPDVEPSPGPHCDELYCPARAACPALRRTAELAAPEEVRRLPLLPTREALRAAGAAREAYHAVQALDAMVETWRQLLKEYVDTVGPIDLGDGREYVAGSKTMESIVADSPAMAVLEEHLGPSYGKALKTSITKSAIAEIARSVAGEGKPGAALERKVLEALRAAQSTRSKAIVTHEVRSAKKGKAA